MTRRVWLGGAVVVAFALAACSASDGLRGEPQPGPALGDVTTTLTRPALTAPEGWTPMRTSVLSGRAGAISAWTGEELLIFRGSGAFSDAGGGEPGRTDGAAYTPETDTWRELADPPFAADRPLFAGSWASAWTGHELVVWGGGPKTQAAAYNPDTDTWRGLDPGPLEARIDFAAVWTGAELVITGGVTQESVLSREPGEDDGALDTGAAYDPVSGTWRTVAESGAGRVSTQAVWDGQQMIVFGGHDGYGYEGAAPSVAIAYDPGTDRWKTLAEPPFNEALAAVWTGSQVVAVVTSQEPSGAGGGGSEGSIVTYDPKTDGWAAVPDAPTASDPQTAPDLISGGVSTVGDWVKPTLAWTGREVVLFGAPIVSPVDRLPLAGYALDVDAGTWRTLPASGLVARGGSSVAWAGSELLIWGGSAYTGFTSEPYADGAIYAPGPGR